MIFQYVAKVEFKIHLKFSHLPPPQKNPCSLPSLPYKNIEGRENNAKVLLKGKVVFVVFQLKL